MFAHIALKNLKDSPLFGYAKDVPFFKGRRRVAFRPGLNILVGPNGSGKSTLLNLLGESVCATQGGVSAITETAIHRGVDMMTRVGRTKDGTASSMTDKLGVLVAHDGQPVIFCDPRQTVGLSGGAFDDDFFRQGLQEVTGRGSHGQKSLGRMGSALAVLTGKAAFPTEVQRHIRAHQVNDLWKEAIGVLDRRLEASIPRGQPTVLLDEPESNYSLLWQARLWSIVSQPEVAKRFQIIAASHSVFALGIAHAHYIDLVPGFRQEVEDSLRTRFAVLPRAPQKLKAPRSKK